MKYCCCHRFVFVLLVLVSSLFGALKDKSVMVYYGKDISYPMVGSAEYIIVQPAFINTNSHGFSVYKEKIYAYVSIGETDKHIKGYQNIQKNWILAENKAWMSEVLDIKNKEYQEYLFKEMIEPRIKEGFKNFFFDTLDSYQLASSTKEEREANEKALASFINLFHQKYPDVKLIINRGFEIIADVHEAIEAVLFESYYMGIGGEKLAYKEVSDEDRVWLDIHINKIKSYGIDVISLEYLDPKDMDKAPAIIEKVQLKGMIPYVAKRELDTYGMSSKNALKREVFTLINEGKLDKVFSSAHRHGALVLEYMGYIQKLHDVRSGLPEIDDMNHYAGVIIWLDDAYKDPEKLMQWVKSVTLSGIKVVFVNNFGVRIDDDSLKTMGISVDKNTKEIKKILHKHTMMGFEIDPPLLHSSVQIHSKNKEPLLIYENTDGTTSTPAAITEWGGYVLGDANMLNINDNYLWVVNPFEFFESALGLKSILVPDPTTENGNRLLFSHIDGDGIMNRVEGNSEHFSGEIILEEILKKYKIPHSASLIGAEIDTHGLYPEIADKLNNIAKEMYSLENVEGATHTFSHPFIWNEIRNNSLDEQYRLKVKDYNFSIEREISQTLDEINLQLYPPHKSPAQTIFWTGDCLPQEEALAYVYSHNILNINGGDTYITNENPWLENIAPLGLQRGAYYQIYTGAQNENIYTNNWLGAFWGFKKVIQTFKLTDSPRRFKPIDIYYHMYSGSKMASLKALEYVFNWALKQEVMPIFTSEYIPKVMDFYIVSIANENDDWLVSGMKELKTLRIEKKGASVDFNNSKSTVGLKHFENHTYISLDNSSQHLIRVDQDKSYKKSSYLVSSNAKITEYINESKTQSIFFEGHVDLKLHFRIKEGCKLSSQPQAREIHKENEMTYLEYKDVKKANIYIICEGL
ncbi:MAG: endo alpha-1,4 polygalactosaminidase [Sulfurospirillum sp.]|nr:endo alpha-1,4 polygalactosaminidase [Sulfurospirillum sp.]